MSLLDDVSIVVTPNGYKAGTLYGVLPTATEGSELVTNGDFSNGETYWFFSTECEVVNNQARIYSSNGGFQYIRQSGILDTTKQYKLEFDVISSNGADLGITGASNVSTSVLGKKTVYFKAISTYLQINRSSGVTDVVIDNVSVKEWTASDMDVTRATAATRVDENGLVNYAEVLGSNLASGYDFTSGWNEFGNETEIENSTSFVSESGQGIYAGLGIVANKTYKIKITGTQPSGGYFSIKAGITGTSFGNINGTSFNETIFATPTVVTGVGNDFYIRLSSHSAGTTITITDLEVQEVDRNNVPRIDYTGGGCPHILAEPQRTNLNSYSDPTDAQKGSISYASVTFEDNYLWGLGGLINNAIVFGDNSTTRYAYYNNTVTSGTEYVLSVFVKMNDNSVPVPLTDFNLALSGSSITSGYNVEVYKNNVYKVTASATASASNTANGVLKVGSHSTKGFRITGFQIEEGSYPTSYIPTSGSTVTRNQDVFTRDGIGSLINDSEGVLFVEMAALVNADATNPNRGLGVSSGSTNNTIFIYFQASTNQLGFIVISGGTTQFSGSTTSFDVTSFNKIALKYKANDFALWINGTEIATDTSGTAPTGLSELTFDNGAGNDKLFGKVKQLQVYDTALTDMQLIQLTGTSGTDFYESYSEMAETLTYTIQ